jgi:hypothetical protein
MKNISSQKRIFDRNELGVLQGKRAINSLILTIIIAVSLIGLGHSIGGLKDLEKRMDNPFTNWVNIPVRVGSQAQATASDLGERFSNKSLRDSFFIDTIRGYRREFYTVSKPGLSGYQFRTARTIERDEPLLYEILKPSNVVYQHPDIQEYLAHDNHWLIVREETLQKMGFSLSEDMSLIFSKDLDSIDLIFQMPVVAVVKELPNAVDMALPQELNVLMFAPLDQYQFIDVSTNNQLKIASIQPLDEALKRIELEVEYTLENDTVSIQEFTLEEKMFFEDTLYVYDLYLTKSLSFSEKQRFVRAALKEHKVKIYARYFQEQGNGLSIDNPQYLAASFNDLRRVRDFRHFVQSEFSLEIDINQVEDKENFSRVSLLTRFLAILVLLGSIVTVLLFVFNLLNGHIDKIQPNLGTLKAFGLSDHTVVGDYTRIMLHFYFKSFLAACVICAVYWMLMYFLDLRFDQKNWAVPTAFDLKHWAVPTALVLNAVSYYILIRQLILNRLNKTPGDLIYNR